MTAGRGRTRDHTRIAIVVASLALLAAGCTQAVAGQAERVAEFGGTESQDPPPDGPNGLKPDAPQPDVAVEGAEPGNQYDELAESTIADLYDFYSQVFPRDFGTDFTEAKQLVSFDSREGATICDTDKKGVVNAQYIPSCDTIIWDRGQLMPMMQDKVGELSAPTVIAHEMGHLVQARLGVARSSTLLLEQQADCYAGAYWRWVHDGNSQYFDFSSGDGMRQMFSAMMWVADPVGLSANNLQAHGSAFDRTFAASLGYSNGPKRCNQITQAEVDQRIQERGFTQLPTNYGNIEVTDTLIQQVTGTLDDYYSQTVPGYQAPKLQRYDSDKPPACEGTTPQPPVDYCPATSTIRYNLSQLQQIGTPEAQWASTNGDFSAMILLASRYSLAAQATGGGSLTGDQAGLRGLCYAGTWANWMKEPQGPDKLQLSPHDLDKAAYQVISSPLAASDVNSRTGTTVLDQIQAFYIGVVYDITTCFAFYGNQQ